MRYRTARRLLDRVDLVLASSGWPIIDPKIGLPATFGVAFRKEMASWKRMVANAPRNLAKVLGVPVVHANLVGDTWQVSASDGRTPELLRFLGNSQIVDGNGRMLAHRRYSSGQGLVIANVQLGQVSGKRAPIPKDEFWFPEFSQQCKDWWYGGGVGRDYYLKNLRKQ